MTDFVDPFKKLKSLIGKPKLFFVNACRGNMMAPTHDSYNHQQHMVEMDYQDNRLNLSRTPIDADILLAYSTVANYFSIRESEFGSWYIQVFCDMIGKYKTTKHLVDILTRVNARVVDNLKTRNLSTSNFQKPMSNYEEWTLKTHKNP